MRHTPLAACLFATIVFNVGCLGILTPSSVELCTKTARCTGDNSYVIDCKADARASIEDARDAGCLSEYNAMSTCFKNNSRCEDNELRLQSFDACDAKLGEFTECYIGFSF